MSSALKRLRIILSLLILLTFIFIYTDSWTQLTLLVSKYLLDFQFIPSLFRTIVGHTLVLGGFLIILLLTVFFGRVYCSLLCPLGVIQDLIIYFKRLFNRKKRIYHRPLKAFKILRYGILVLLIISLVAHSTIVLIWLDPYSISGRMVSHLLRPVINAGFNMGVAGLSHLDFFNVLPVDWAFRPHAAFWAAVGWFLLLLFLSLRYGRIYCNTLCPLGTFLGLLSSLSIFKVRIREGKCTSCGRCSKVCKAGCIDLEEKSVDFTRCVGCLNCIESCDHSAINYYFSGQREKVAVTIDSKNRRRVLKSLGLFSLIPVIKIKDDLLRAAVPSKQEDFPRRKAITPPGSLGRYHFTEHCTACHLCVNRCPTQVLQPYGSEISIESMFQPVMDFSVKYCLYDCNICTLICPTGAIYPLSITDKKKVQLGKSRFLEHLCVVVTKGTLCGACSERCPTKACDMVPYKDNLSIPKVDNRICVGCGACEYSCPTNPKAIVVDENIIHLIAEQPRKKVLEPLTNKGKEVPEDFPF